MKNKRVKQMMVDTTKNRYPHSGACWWDKNKMLIDGVNDYEFTFEIDLGQVSLTANQLKDNK